MIGLGSILDWPKLDPEVAEDYAAWRKLSDNAFRRAAHDAGSFAEFRSKRERERAADAMMDLVAKNPEWTHIS